MHEYLHFGNFTSALFAPLPSPIVQVPRAFWEADAKRRAPAHREKSYELNHKSDLNYDDRSVETRKSAAAVSWCLSV